MPTGRDVTRGVLGKLQIFGSVGASSLPASISFVPSMVIVAGNIDKLGIDIRSFHEPLTRSIRDVMQESIRKNFNVGGRPAWEPLSDATLEIRTNWGNPNTDPLVWTGTLRQVASQLNIWTITKTSALIVSLPQKVWYGAIHQGGYGGTGGSKGTKGQSLHDIVENARANALDGSGNRGGTAPIPARPFIVLQPEDEDRITEIFIEWLGERVSRSWR